MPHGYECCYVVAHNSWNILEIKHWNTLIQTNINNETASNNRKCIQNILRKYNNRRCMQNVLRKYSWY